MIHQAELLGVDWQLLYGGRSRDSMAFAGELSAAVSAAVSASTSPAWRPKPC